MGANSKVLDIDTLRISTVCVYFVSVKRGVASKLLTQKTLYYA